MAVQRSSVETLSTTTAKMAATDVERSVDSAIEGRY
jgi:hypothetical protein